MLLLLLLFGTGILEVLLSAIVLVAVIAFIVWLFKTGFWFIGYLILLLLI